MPITDLFKRNEYRERIKQLENELAHANNLLTPEIQDAVALQNKIDIKYG